MKIAQLMTKSVQTINGESLVSEAITLLADRHLSALPVVDHGGRLIGVISASDILRNEAESATPEEREELFRETLVREIMTAKPSVIAPRATAREAAQQMLYQEIHRLYVVDEGKLVGVISQSDLVRDVATAREPVT